MKKITIIGLFCDNLEVSDGQSIKTRIVTQKLENALGSAQVARVDTYGWKKKPLRLLLRCVLAVMNSENVVFMTDEGGIKVFPWLLLGANLIPKRKLHYVVVGGWLVHFLKKHAFIANCLKRFDNIFVETTVMQNGLKDLGFQNALLMPNFKTLKPLTENDLCPNAQEPYRFCMFSRVMEEKGIEDAVKAIQSVNHRLGRNACALDIYGQVDPNQTEWFAKLESSFSKEICYRGIVPYDKSVEVLKEYFALLFPTKFYTEGNPGTIIDAYAAGLPVIASQWESFADMVDHQLTGIGYPFLQTECLEDIIMEVVRTPSIIMNMKTNCLAKAKNYLPENVIDILLERL